MLQHFCADAVVITGPSVSACHRTAVALGRVEQEYIKQLPLSNPCTTSVSFAQNFSGVGDRCARTQEGGSGRKQDRMEGVGHRQRVRQMAHGVGDRYPWALLC